MFNDDQYYGDYDSFFEYKINTVLSFLGLRSQLASKAEPEQRRLTGRERRCISESPLVLSTQLLTECITVTEATYIISNLACHGKGVWGRLGSNGIT